MISSEKRETPTNNGPEKKGEQTTGTIDLENKILQIGLQKYFIDMKETNGARFFRVVEVLPQCQRSRIVVPMVCAADFCQKLEESNNFASKYCCGMAPAPEVKKSERGTAERNNFVHSCSIATAGKRRYYFDLIEENGNLKLKMSYVYGERRDNVHIVVDALPDLLKILQSFVVNYPSLSEKEDSPPKFNSNRRNYGDRQRRSYEQQQRYPRQAPAAQSPNSQSENRRVNLKVLEDPAPFSLDINAKTFTFEVVQGANSFLRLTEIINGMRKSTIHVPVEGCPEMLRVLGDFTKKININNGDVSAHDVAKPAKA